MKPVKDIDEYITRAPKEVQVRLRELRRTISQEAPEAIEAISYQMPTFKLQGKNLVHFAAFTKHIGFFPTASHLGSSLPEVAQYRTGKGTLQFAHDKPLPLELVRKIVRVRVQEMMKG